MLKDTLPNNARSVAAFANGPAPGTTNRTFDNRLVEILTVHNCGVDSDSYNPIASLLMRPGADAVKVLFQQVRANTSSFTARFARR